MQWTFPWLREREQRIQLLEVSRVLCSNPFTVLRPTVELTAQGPNQVPIWTEWRSLDRQDRIPLVPHPKKKLFSQGFCRLLLAKPTKPLWAAPYPFLLSEQLIHPLWWAGCYFCGREIGAEGLRGQRGHLAQSLHSTDRGAEVRGREGTP